LVVVCADKHWVLIALLNSRALAFRSLHQVRIMSEHSKPLQELSDRQGSTSTPRGLLSPNATAPISLERKLELLESRFTQPQVGSAGGSTLDSRTTSPPPIMSTSLAASGGLSGTTTNSHSEHSFSFSSSRLSADGSSSNLPSSSVRSRRRSSLNTSFYAVERATSRHLRKVQASSPINGLSSNHSNASGNFMLGNPLTTFQSSSPSSSSSQQTLLTSHVQAPKAHRVVADTPPSNAVPVTPNPVAQRAMQPPKPAAARNILPPPAQTPTGVRNASSKGAANTGGAQTVSIQLVNHILFSKFTVY